MKAIIFRLSAFFCLAGTLVSCMQQAGEEERLFSLEIDAALSIPSRVTGDTGAGESHVSAFQIFVFDREGLLEASGRSSSGSVSLRCRAGDKTIRALANAPVPSSILRLSDLEMLVSRLDDNAPGSLVMYGAADISVRADMRAAVVLERLCAKVVVGKISKSFTSSVLQQKTLLIRRIYMTNVAADRTLVPSVISLWYNKLGYQGDGSSLLCDAVGRVAAPTLDEVHTFYVYPNGSLSGVRGGAWSPRPTRLVIDAELDGVRCYYVIDIPGIEGNHAYELSDIVLTRPGAGDEESLSTGSAVRFTFNVVPWSGAASYVENL